MERKHACDECEYSTRKPSNLIQHKESKHEKVRFTCDQCEDDYDNTIKAEVLEEDPLAGY